ncbi:hypothetical protein AB4254_08885 [Vibrio breoganii]
MEKLQLVNSISEDFYEAVNFFFEDADALSDSMSSYEAINAITLEASKHAFRVTQPRVSHKLFSMLNNTAVQDIYRVQLESPQGRIHNPTKRAKEAYDCLESFCYDILNVSALKPTGLNNIVIEDPRTPKIKDNCFNSIIELGAAPRRKALDLRFIGGTKERALLSEINGKSINQFHAFLRSSLLPSRLYTQKVVHDIPYIISLTQTLITYSNIKYNEAVEEELRKAMH